MEKREKIKQIYQKFNVNVGEEYIDEIMKNKERLESLMRTYKDEEIDSMNEIFGKDYSNKVFTEKELEFASKMDLFDRYMINVAKEIWKVKDNTKVLKAYLKILENEGKEKGKKVLNSFKEREVIVNISNGY